MTSKIKDIFYITLGLAERILNRIVKGTMVEIWFSHDEIYADNFKEATFSLQFFVATCVVAFLVAICLLQLLLLKLLVALLQQFLIEDFINSLIVR